MKINNKLLLGIIIFLAFIVRLFPLDFPSFTSDEARIAHRGYVLAKEGKDELGRNFPFLFNSLEDYQLPVVSYLAAGGVYLFGKSDFGARIFFILIGTGIVFLTYRAAGVFFGKNNFGIYAAIIAAFSPALIFFSKIPNEFIIGAFLLLLLLPGLYSGNLRKFNIFIIFLLMLLTSKILWLILIPLIFLALLSKNIHKTDKIYLGIWIFIIAAVFVFFSKIPQGVRSLLENNFAILSDSTVKNGIDKLRGQGSLWQASFFDRLLFNKAYLIGAGFFHWFSQISLSRLFAEFDPSGAYGMLKTGAFQKILIIPYLTGIYFLLRNNSKRIFLYILLFTSPLVLLYPKEKSELIVLALPLFALVSAAGFYFFNRKLALLLLFIAVVEFSSGLFFLGATVKNSNNLRPLWVKNIILEAEKLSDNSDIAFSDDLIGDIAPLISWTADPNPADSYEDIPFPYKYRQSRISNYKIIASGDSFYNCGFDKATYIFASRRDLKKIQGNIKTFPDKSYKDLFGEDSVFLMPSTICVK